MDNAIDLTFSPTTTSSTRYALAESFSDEFEDMDGDNGLSDVEELASEEEEDRKLPAAPTTSHNTSPTEASSEDSSLNRGNTIDLSSPLYAQHRVDHPSATGRHEHFESEETEGMDIDVEETDVTSQDDRKMPARQPASSTTYLTDSSDNSSDGDRKIAARQVTILNSDSSDDEDDVVLCWPCPQCTLVNSNDRSICEACHMPRNPESRQNATSSRTHPPAFASRETPNHGSASRTVGPTSPHSPPPPFGLSLQSPYATPMSFSQFISAHRQSAAALNQPQQAILRRRISQRLSHQRGVDMEALRQMQARLLQARMLQARVMQAAHSRNTDSMNYEQLLQAFGDGTENMGASDSAIQQLPVSTLMDPATELPEDRRTCNICLEDFVAGDERRTLPCLHGYHKECADKWLKTNRTCPVCKHSIE